MLTGVCGFYGLKLAAPEFFKSRVSDPSDLYARIAQHKQTLQLFLGHPFNGVGLGNYPQAAMSIPSATYRGVDSVGSAHNTLGALLADTGVTGFIPFVLAQIFLFRAFWRLRKHGSPQAVLASTFFLYVFLSYWVTGVMLTSGYYSDINLWYCFVVGVLYKFAALGSGQREVWLRQTTLVRRSMDLSPSTA
jgi:O-antigen ligase